MVGVSAGKMEDRVLRNCAVLIYLPSEMALAGRVRCTLTTLSLCSLFAVQGGGKGALRAGLQGHQSARGRLLWTRVRRLHRYQGP